MFKRYPSLQSLQAFLQAADSSSFSQAARQMDLTHSAISQQIRNLESFVGHALFVREKGGVKLTRTGRLLASSLADELALIDRTLSDIRHHHTTRTLTLSVDAELAQAWLNSRLPALMAAFSDNTITILTGVARQPGLPEGADVALRYGYGEWADCEVSPICDDQVVAVASPEFAARWGLVPPIDPAQLLDVPLLGYTRRTWTLWLDSVHLPSVEPQAAALFDNVANLLAAAEAGVGAGLTRKLLAADALRDGRLILLANATIPTQYNLYAIWPKGHAERASPVVEVIKKLGRESLAAKEHATEEAPAIDKVSAAKKTTRPKRKNHHAEKGDLLR